MCKRIAALIMIMATLPSGCTTIAPPGQATTTATAPDWDPSPATIAVEALQCCGLAPGWFSENYVPHARVWGDGRIVWAEYNETGQRRVLEGRLTPEQMRALMARIVQAGFLQWDERYQPADPPTDMPTTTAKMT